MLLLRFQQRYKKNQSQNTTLIFYKIFFDVSQIKNNHLQYITNPKSPKRLQFIIGIF